MPLRPFGIGRNSLRLPAHQNTHRQQPSAQQPHAGGFWNGGNIDEADSTYVCDLSAVIEPSAREVDLNRCSRCRRRSVNKPRSGKFSAQRVTAHRAIARAVQSPRNWSAEHSCEQRAAADVAVGAGDLERTSTRKRSSHGQASRGKGARREGDGSHVCPRRIADARQLCVR